MRKIWLGVGGGLVLAGAAAGYGVFIHPDRAFRAALDDAITLLPPGYTVGYDGAHYSLLSQRATVTGLTVRGSSPWFGELAIGTVEVVRPNLGFAAAWAHAAAAPPALAPDAVIPIADAIVLKDSRLTGERVSGTTALSRVDGARVFPAALLGHDLPSWREALAALDRPPERLTIADVQPALRLAAAWALAVASDAQTSENATGRVAMPNNPLYPSGELVYTLRRSSAGPHGAGKIATLTAEGLTSSSGPTMGMTLDAVTVAIVDAEKPLRRVLAGEPVAAGLLDGLALGKAEYRGLEIRATPGATPSRAQAMSIADMRFIGDMPVSARTAITALELKRESMTEALMKQAFDMLGLDTITATVVIDYRWDLAGQRLDLREVTLTLVDLFTLTASLDAVEAVPTLAFWERARVAKARVRLEDRSFLDRAFKAFGGKTTGLTRTELSAVAQMQGNGPGATPEVKVAATAVSNFLKAPGALTIELAPPRPVSLTDITALARGSPADILTILGARFSAEK